ncbi:MAG: RnfABCDGE type electron transport complex subunit G [Pyramidobacter sp.]|jgi:electron transport complex protein RnfG
MSNKILRLSAVLFGITAVTGLLLGIVQHVTSAPIAEQRQKQRARALEATLPQAESFALVPVEGSGIISEIAKGTSGGETAGYCFTLKPKGFGGILTLVCGIADDGQVMDISILESNETPGLGAQASKPAFAGQFHQRRTSGLLTVVKTPVENDDQIQAISGATITSRAITDAVNEALRYWSAHFKAQSGETRTDSIAKVQSSTVTEEIGDSNESSQTEGAK